MWEPRCRRFLPLLLLVAGLAVVQFVVDPTLLLDALHGVGPPRKRASDGGPLHVLLTCYARSGSSFAGDLLQSLPSSLLHFEPLHFLSSPVLAQPPLAAAARDLLANLYTCNVTQIHGFMRWQKQHKNFMKLMRSIRYWDECYKPKKKACFNSTYMDLYCRKRQTIIAKTIRLKLRDAAELFTSHPHLNLRIVYLVRDPRGTISSRNKYPVTVWCKNDPTCFDVKEFCAILRDDLEVVCSLSRDHAGEVRILRYEDLSIDPFGVTERLMDFLGWEKIPRETVEFLKSHTSVVGNAGDKGKALGVEFHYSTFRNSSETAMSWRQQMSFEKVTEIQSECGDVLAGFGYHSYSTLASLRSNKDFDTNLSDAVRAFCSKR